MKKTAVTALALSLLNSPLSASEHASWGYTGDAGPDHWGTLSTEYSDCKAGKNQSPVDLGHLINAKLPDAEFSYYAPPQEILNNGHTIQVTPGHNNKIDVDGHIYELKQMHFHSPSEHTINGEHFPMEAHFVHGDKDGNLAVVAVLFRINKPNHAIDTLWKQIPLNAGESRQLKPPTGSCGLAPEVGACGLLPQDKDYLRYNGSLTTPPCSEGVLWIVMKTPMSVSAKQVELFQKVMKHPNSRPVQALNARVVLK